MCCKFSNAPRQLNMTSTLMHCLHPMNNSWMQRHYGAAVNAPGPDVFLWEAALWGKKFTASQETRLLSWTSRILWFPQVVMPITEPFASVRCCRCCTEALWDLPEAESGCIYEVSEALLDGFQIHVNLEESLILANLLVPWCFPWCSLYMVPLSTPIFPLNACK